MAELPKQGLGVVLRLSREARGWSRRDLAAASGLSYPYISELETGAKYPSVRALENLAGALDLDPGQLEGRARESEADAGLDTRVQSLQVAVAVASDRDREDLLVSRVLDQIEPIVRAVIRAALEGGQ